MKDTRAFKVQYASDRLCPCQYGACGYCGQLGAHDRCTSVTHPEAPEARPATYLCDRAGGVLEAVFELGHPHRWVCDCHAAGHQGPPYSDQATGYKINSCGKCGASHQGHGLGATAGQPHDWVPPRHRHDEQFAITGAFAEPMTKPTEEAITANVRRKIERHWRGDHKTWVFGCPPCDRRLDKETQAEIRRASIKQLALF